MIRIASGTTDQYVYFYAGVTGLSNFTVYRSRNGAAAVAMTTPSVTEVDPVNMPGVYQLLMDEDMTVGSGNASEHMVFHVTAAGMTPVVIEIELYQPPALRKGVAFANFQFVMKDTSGNGATSLTVTAERAIDNGSFAACANSVVEVGFGVYRINLASTDLNGNVITLKFSATGAVTKFITLVPAAA